MLHQVISDIIQFMKVVIFQSPLVQLNTPYPSGAYLKSFFLQQDIIKFSSVQWFDLSNLLYNNIFSKTGLTKLFELTTEKALHIAQESNDENTSFNLRRYIFQKDSWINWIDKIKSILTDSNGREFCHEFIFSPFAPRGSRMENFLSQLNREVTIDDARFLASFALADLADYINVVFDKNTRDYNKSSLKKLIEKDIQPIIENAIGADNLIEHEVDLTSVDMQNEFGTCKCKVRPITFDEAREFNEILVNKDLPDWWWTCTPWSTKERGWRWSMAVVSPSGDVSNGCCGYDSVVRPFCILKSNIFVSKGE